MENLLRAAIETAQRADFAYTKFITPNDVGATGAHQSGFHIHHNGWPMFFSEPGKKGSNKSERIVITWQQEFSTESRAVYYGEKTRNEYRLTRFGHGFPYLTDDHIGDLLVLCRLPKDDYQAYVLHSEEDIEEFFAALNISPANANGLIQPQGPPRQREIWPQEPTRPLAFPPESTTEPESTIRPEPIQPESPTQPESPIQPESTTQPEPTTPSQTQPEVTLINYFTTFLSTLTTDFPDTELLSRTARESYRAAYNTTNRTITADPDKEILNWLEAEFQLFRLIETDRYSQRIQKPFSTVEELIETANTLLQRRKSRAGFSLEHHLSAIFKAFGLQFEEQGLTEGRKKPDFIFPGSKAYKDEKFDETKLFILAAKTTCKDRWRQVINEADRVKTKHLFTLQQGISPAQLTEMFQANVHLVVPKPYLKNYPAEFRDRILTLEKFVQMVLVSQ